MLPRMRLIVALKFAPGPVECPMERPTGHLVEHLAERLADAERDRLAIWLPVFMGVGVAGYYALRSEPAAWIGPAVPCDGSGCDRMARARLLLARLLPLRWVRIGAIATARAPPVEPRCRRTPTTVPAPSERSRHAGGRRFTIQPPTWMPRPHCWYGRCESIADRDGEVLDSGDQVRIRALVRHRHGRPILAVGPAARCVSTPPRRIPGFALGSA